MRLNHPAITSLRYVTDQESVAKMMLKKSEEKNNDSWVCVLFCMAV